MREFYCLWPCSLAITSTGRVGLWFCGFISTSTRRLTDNGSHFKASQKTGPRFKVSSDRLREAGNRTCDTWSRRRTWMTIINMYPFVLIFY